VLVRSPKLKNNIIVIVLAKISSTADVDDKGG